ncbi:MAG: hypothetical protein KBT11_05325 [Treponema sp.]|nr:hypothetical protein [Candidatus Treponema equifaecale]
MKKILTIMMAAFALIMLASCGSPLKGKTFEAHSLPDSALKATVRITFTDNKHYTGSYPIEGCNGNHNFEGEYEYDSDGGIRVRFYQPKDYDKKYHPADDSHNVSHHVGGYLNTYANYYEDAEKLVGFKEAFIFKDLVLSDFDLVKEK